MLLTFTITVKSQLSDINKAKSCSDNQKCQKTWKINEKDKAKHELSLYSICDIIKLLRKYNVGSNKKSQKQIQYLT